MEALLDFLSSSSFVALLAVSSTFGLGLAQLIYANRRAVQIDARDKLVREDERRRAQDDTRAELGARRRALRITAMETYARLCNEHIARQRSRVAVPRAERDATPESWVPALQQIAVTEIAAYSASLALNLDGLGPTFSGMWEVMQGFDRLIDQDDVDHEAIQTLIDRFGTLMAEIDRRIGDLEQAS